MAWMIYGRRVVHLHARSRVQRVAAARLGLEGQAALHALLVLRALVGRAVLLRLAKHIPKVLLGGREANDQQEAHRLKCGGGWRAVANADASTRLHGARPTPTPNGARLSALHARLRLRLRLGPAKAKARARQGLGKG